MPLAVVEEKCHLSCQPTKDAAAIKPSATATAPTVHPEGIQDGEKQDDGPAELRCISKEWFQ